MRLVRVEIAREILPRLVREHRIWHRPQRGACLPADAELAWMYLSTDGRTLSLVFTHPSFDDVPEGAEIPQREVIFETWRPAVASYLTRSQS